MNALLYAPDYLNDYTCKCGACRHTCCTQADWDICLSSREYRDALALLPADAPADPLGAVIAGLLPDDGDTVRLPTAPDGRCALLSPDGTCSWRNVHQRDLCSVCRDFPVTRITVENRTYACASGACEAVLEVLARKTEPIKLAASERDGEKTGAPAGGDPAIQRAYPTLQELGLRLLQDGRYPLDQRMGVLVAYLNVAIQMVRVGQGDRLPQALDDLMDSARVHATIEGFARDQRPGNPAVRLCSELYLTCLSSTAYEPAARRVLENMGFSVVGHRSGVRGRLVLSNPNLLEQRRTHLRPYMERKEAYLGRVLANLYLHNGVVLAPPDPWSSVRYFALCYALIKFGILGFFDEEPDDQELIDLLVVLLRAFAHNGGLYRNTLRWINDLQFDDVNDVIKTVLW